MDLLSGMKLVPTVAAPMAAIAILLIQRKSWKVYALAFQYVMVAWLLVSPLPVESAGAKLLAGCVAAVILFLGAVRAGPSSGALVAGEGFPRGRIFRLIAVLIVVVGILGVSFEAWIPAGAIPPDVGRSALLLAALGILGIGFSSDPTQVGISLITVVSGFEIVYSAIEPSLAIVALLALVHLGIALTVSYFEIIRSEYEPEPAVER